MGPVWQNVKPTFISNVFIAGKPNIAFLGEEAKHQEAKAGHPQAGGGKHGEPVGKGIDYPDRGHSGRIASKG